MPAIRLTGDQNEVGNPNPSRSRSAASIASEPTAIRGSHVATERDENQTSRGGLPASRRADPRAITWRRRMPTAARVLGSAATLDRARPGWQPDGYRPGSLRPKIPPAPKTQRQNALIPLPPTGFACAFNANGVGGERTGAAQLPRGPRWVSVDCTL